jgi:hypothetical protein
VSKWLTAAAVFFFVLCASVPAQGLRVSTYKRTVHTGVSEILHFERQYGYGRGQTNIAYTNIVANPNQTPPAATVILDSSTNVWTWDFSLWSLSTNYTSDWINLHADGSAETGQVTHEGDNEPPSFTGEYPYPAVDIPGLVENVSFQYETGGDTNSPLTRVYIIHVEAKEGANLVPPGEITVAGQTCDGDGNVAVTWADCTTNGFSASFGARTNVYFKVDVGMVRPQIFRITGTYVIGVNEQGNFTNVFTSTNVITDKTNFVLAGELINLYCKMATDAGVVVTNPAITGWDWTIPGQTVSNYVATTPLGKKYEGYPKNQESCVYYWYNRSINTFTVVCNATVNGQPVQSKAYFDVYKPSGTLGMRNGAPAAADANWFKAPGVFSIHYGGSPPVDPVHGVYYDPTVTVAEGISADYKMCQIVNSVESKQSLNAQGGPWSGVKGTKKLTGNFHGHTSSIRQDLAQTKFRVRSRWMFSFRPSSS